MVAIGILGSVLLEGSLVAGKTSLAQLESIRSLSWLVKAKLCSRLEGLISGELRLEVHPVLRSGTKGLL